MTIIKITKVVISRLLIFGSSFFNSSTLIFWSFEVSIRINNLKINNINIKIAKPTGMAIAMYDIGETSSFAAFSASTGNTWAIGVIPLLIETVKPSPIINILPILSLFSIFAILRISYKIGSMTTNKTEGDMNNPNNKTEERNRLIKKKPPFLASLLFTNAIAMRFINEVLDKAYVQTNVKSKNINVEFPKLACNIFVKPKLSIKDKEKMQSKLGQSIPIVSHNINVPKKIKITPNASLDRPPQGGMNLPNRHNATQIGMIINLKIMLSFSFVLFMDFLS